MVVPSNWQLDDNPDATAEQLCAHVARETYGPFAEVVDVLDPVYQSALEDVRRTAKEKGMTVDVVDPVLHLLRTRGADPRQHGLKWLRVVRVPSVKVM